MSLPFRSTRSKPASSVAVTLCLCVTTFSSRCGAVTTVSTMRTVNPTTSAGCPALDLCLEDANCSACWDAVAPFAPPVQAVPHLRSTLQSNLLHALSTIPSCFTNTSIPLLQEVVLGCPLQFDECQREELLCMTGEACKQCLTAIKDNPHTPSLLQSHACIEADKSRFGLVGPGTTTLAQLAYTCLDFPSCTYFKLLCNRTGTCVECLDVWKTYGSTHGYAAATQRCDELGGNSSLPVRAIVRGVLESCTGTMYDPQVASSCAPCLVHESTSPQCDALLRWSEVATSCEPCSESIHEVNRISLATQIVGTISVVACIAVMLTILAHRQERVSFRARIVLGVMLANAVFSIGNAIPIGNLRTGVLDCGQFAFEFRSIRLVRAVWFGGKYGLVAFEIFILVASITTLKWGTRAVLSRVEPLLHLLCIVCGVAAATTFSLKCTKINSDGYNSSTQMLAQSNAYSFLSVSDDKDDDTIEITAAERFASGRRKYDQLVQVLLRVWVGALGLAVSLWICLRWAHHSAVQIWKKRKRQVIVAMDSDDWQSTRRRRWQEIGQLVDDQRLGYKDIVKPLEPFVWVFLVFAVPAVIMATEWCVDRSAASPHAASESDQDTRLTGGIAYGACDVWCELILAFRSLATVIVYLYPRERRSEFFQMGVTCQLLLARLLCRSKENVDTSTNIELEALLPEQPAHTQAAEQNWDIKPEDVELERELAAGSFGVVWQGTWQDNRVAIKVLRGPVHDSDGSTVEFDDDCNFQEECEILKSCRHDRLLRFYGYGVRHDGCGMIVTELLCGGALRSLLKDSTTTLEWVIRESIACDIAHGMVHLHKIKIIHRDLKSHNVLLDGKCRAKVADFGTSRRFRPVSATRIRPSPFTGIPRRSESEDDPIAVQTRESSLANEFLSVASPSVDGEGSVMSKSTGTFPWMAPEIYRGDVFYTDAVDVYSFGMILWELATRKVPWAEYVGIELFRHLDKVLQNGERPPISECISSAHPRFVQLMRVCWSGDPDNRPLFHEIVDLFDSQSLRHVWSPRPKTIYE